MAKRILLVDDERDLVETLSFRLEANNYEVIKAYDGQEGLDKAKKEKPDLIILDVMMPKMDGSTMAAALREDEKLCSIPIIFLTCLVSKDETVSETNPIGGNIYLAKPFNAEELLVVVKKVLSGRVK